jgi:hypothetical protein
VRVNAHEAGEAPFVPVRQVEHLFLNTYAKRECVEPLCTQSANDAYSFGYYTKSEGQSGKGLKDDDKEGRSELFLLSKLSENTIELIMLKDAWLHKIKNF